MEAVKLSADFKRQASRAIAAIVFFIATYLVLLGLAIALTVVCIYGGLALIALRPSFITIALGLGLASFGILVLIFLVKFVTQSRKPDRSHLIELNQSDEPALFKLIGEIVGEVKTTFPKRIYLSSDVDASVFYDSSFWSMFFPVRKNLQIGLGLVNILTALELKAVLAHEFGHFSQRSMKVGSFVYNVNQVIFNMLYENNSYNDMIQRWAGFSSYFSIFVVLAVKVVGGIQFILQKLYAVVNKSYLGLSREMEFHADEIAANVTGPQPLQLALLRLNIADTALNDVLVYYSSDKKGNLRSRNIYRDQSYVMNFIAERNGIPVVGQLPHVTPEAYRSFNKSKLVLKDQWASHPTTEERVEKLSQLGEIRKPVTTEPAGILFKSYELTQIALTDNLFRTASNSSDPVIEPAENFREAYQKEVVKHSFPDLYNGYYDNRNPVAFPVYASVQKEDQAIVAELFSREKVDMVNASIALQNDLTVIRQIGEGLIPAKTFDYAGRKHKAADIPGLLPDLEHELKTLNSLIEKNDERIFKHFRNLELKRNGSRMALLYSELTQAEKDLATDGAIVDRLNSELQFIQETTPVETIQENFSRIRSMEQELKSKIRALMTSPPYELALTLEVRERFEKYLSQDWHYFGVESYIDNNLELLFGSINAYAQAISWAYFLLKKELLTYQEQLLTPASSTDTATQ